MRCIVNTAQGGVSLTTVMCFMCVLCRCHGEPLQAIRKSILQGLNLQQEPRLQGTGMAELREQWKAALKASGHSGHPIQSPPHMTGTPPETAHLVSYD